MAAILRWLYLSGKRHRVYFRYQSNHLSERELVVAGPGWEHAVRGRDRRSPRGFARKNYSSIWFAGTDPPKTQPTDSRRAPLALRTPAGFPDPRPSLFPSRQSRNRSLIVSCHGRQYKTPPASSQGAFCAGRRPLFVGAVLSGCTVGLRCSAAASRSHSPPSQRDGGIDPDRRLLRFSWS